MKNKLGIKINIAHHLALIIWYNKLKISNRTLIKRDVKITESLKSFKFKKALTTKKKINHNQKTA